MPFKKCILIHRKEGIFIRVHMKRNTFGCQTAVESQTPCATLLSQQQQPKHGSNIGDSPAATSNRFRNSSHGECVENADKWVLGFRYDVLRTRIS